MGLDLMKLFDGYVRNYHSLNLTIHHGKHSFTMTEIEYFSRLGSMLGYFPFTEDTFNGENRPMDLTWWDNLDGEVWNDFVLHLERENYFKKDFETLEKLFDERKTIDPVHVIGIMNVKSFERMQELLSSAQRMCKIDNALLIFRITSDKSKRYFDKTYAYLLNHNKIVNEKVADVSDMSGLLYMYYENEK